MLDNIVQTGDPRVLLAGISCLIPKAKKHYMINIHSKKAKQTGAIVAFFLLVIFAAYLNSVRYPSTDDAYIQANVIQISPQVSGPIAKLYVENYESVKKGQPLLDIDPAPFIVAVKKAKAQLDYSKQTVAALEETVKSGEAIVTERESELSLAQKDYDRIMVVVKKHLLSQSEGDRVTSRLNVAKATLLSALKQLEQAKAQLGEPGQHNAQIRSAEEELAHAKLDLEHTHITSPANGYVINLSAREGTMLNNGNIAFAVIDSNKWWVDANFKETSLERIRLGQTATIVVDTYPDHDFHGIVEKISRGSGAAFSLFPAENATGNWVKVTQRFTVKIVISDPDPKFPLNVGASSLVTVDTT